MGPTRGTGSGPFSEDSQGRAWALGSKRLEFEPWLHCRQGVLLSLSEPRLVVQEGTVHLLECGASAAEYSGESEELWSSAGDRQKPGNEHRKTRSALGTEHCARVKGNGKLLWKEWPGRSVS
ncbi:hypothetical protein H1C71_028813 [Ictidomys tridecemlineatus]|nr:hypothetical protein H1C71_028813 [Ictidomys tridecemlineatus]